MDKNPITKIVDWYNEAKKTEINDPDAITLATVDDTGFPNIRTVLLRKIDSDSFVFFTNYNSQKGNEIENNNNVAFSFHWKSLATINFHSEIIKHHYFSVGNNLNSLTFVGN